MTPILKRTYFIIGIIMYLYLSYQIIIFLKCLQKIPLLPRVIMSVYKGPTVTISGRIIFKDYKKGFISIEVFAKEPKRGRQPLAQVIIASERIPKPGFYKIRVPKKIGKVYIIARNLDIEDISKMPTPRLFPIGIGKYYVKNPLEVGNNDINGLDIEISPFIKNIYDEEYSHTNAIEIN